MAGVLITGFEPFGGETVNPSWEVVKQLDGMIIRGQQVVAKQLPCVFGEALSPSGSWAASWCLSPASTIPGMKPT